MDKYKIDSKDGRYMDIRVYVHIDTYYACELISRFLEAQPFSAESEEKNENKVFSVCASLDHLFFLVITNKFNTYTISSVLAC